MNADGPKGLGLLAGLLVALRIMWRTLRGAPPPPAAPDGAPSSSDGASAGDDDPREREVPGNRRAETVVALLMFGAAASALGFIAVYVVAQFDTQLLGLALGCAFALLAAAAIIAGKMVVPQETEVEERDQLLKPSQVEEVVEMVESGGEGVSRRGLLTCAGCVAGGAMVAAVATPLASLGPASRALHKSPWRRGVALVNDESGSPYSDDEIEVGTFYTALAEGADPEALGSGVLLVRLPPHYIHLPADRRTWAPHGLLAFSKICPHAACAISLYRYPTYAPSSVAQPAFTCPCHYSTFLPGRGGELIFGPAGRELPQLPLMIDSKGDIRAAGDFDEDVGPSWWGVRRT